MRRQLCLQKLAKQLIDIAPRVVTEHNQRGKQDKPHHIRERLRARGQQIHDRFNARGGPYPAEVCQHERRKDQKNPPGVFPYKLFEQFVIP